MFRCQAASFPSSSTSDSTDSPFKNNCTNPKGPCTQIVYTLGPMYLHREYFKANVYTIWVHGPLGKAVVRETDLLSESSRRGLCAPLVLSAGIPAAPRVAVLSMFYGPDRL